MLPAAFVRATLVALDLPPHLAERYTAPCVGQRPPVRRRTVHPGPLQPAHRSYQHDWPFPRG
jgi:hypothetical protein